VLNLGIEGIMVAGAFTGWLVVYLGAPRSDGAPSAAATAMTRSDRASAPRASLCVDLSQLVGRFEHVADLARESARLDGRAVDVADGRLHTG